MKINFGVKTLRIQHVRGSITFLYIVLPPFHNKLSGSVPAQEQQRLNQRNQVTGLTTNNAAE